MKVITFKEQVVEVENAYSLISAYKTEYKLVVSFTTPDMLLHIAHVHMSPAEARNLAIQLIVFAEKVSGLQLI